MSCIVPEIVTFPLALQAGDLPDDVDWAHVFQIKDEHVFRVCQSFDPSLKRGRFNNNNNAGFHNKRPDENQELEAWNSIEFARRLSKFEKDAELLCLGK